MIFVTVIFNIILGLMACAALGIGTWAVFETLDWLF